MAWRLQEYVTRGEIDNRTPGRVTGRIWLQGVEEPLVLDLEGNCRSDLAGCLLTFENPAPLPLESSPPALLQQGRTGEMTASRKVRVPEVPIEEFIRLSAEGIPAPEHLANCLSLEWFSKVSGRVVIESADFQLQISTPEWRLSQDAPLQPASEITSDLGSMEGDFLSDSPEDTEESVPWDEFRHERALRERDALTEKFSKLFDKYRDHPDRDRIIAREMGWDWLEEVSDEDEEDGPDNDFSNGDPEDLVEGGDWGKPAPNPAREGIDWIRTPDGEIRHPLYHRAFQFTTDLHNFCEEQGLLEDTDPDLEEFLSQISLLAAKLSGALTDLADGTNLYEPGFVVALLKRALEILNRSLAALGTVELKSLLPTSRVTTCQDELLSIREEMLRLIQEFRKRVC